MVFPYLVRHQDQALPPGATSCWRARPPDLACPAPCLLSGVPLFHVLTPPHSQGLAWQASSPHATSAPWKQQLHLDAPGTELHASVVRLARVSGSQATPTDPLLPPALPRRYVANLSLSRSCWHTDHSGAFPGVRRDFRDLLCQCRPQRTPFMGPPGAATGRHWECKEKADCPCLEGITASLRGWRPRK